MALLVKTLNGLAYASIKTRGGLAVASIKTINGLDATASSYLLSENFEGTGYENAWTEAGTGTMDEDYTTSPAPLEGSQSLRIVASSQTPNVLSPTFAAQSTIEAYFMLNVASIPSAARTIFQFRDSAGTLASIQITSTGLLRINSGVSATTVDALSAATTYHVFARYVKGTGANGVITIGFSTDGTRPSSGNKFASSSSATATTDCDRVMIGNTASGTITFIIDKVRVSASTIGDNPT